MREAELYLARPRPDAALEPVDDLQLRRDADDRDVRLPFPHGVQKVVQQRLFLPGDAKASSSSSTKITGPLPARAVRRDERSSDMLDWKESARPPVAGALDDSSELLAELLMLLLTLLPKLGVGALDSAAEAERSRFASCLLAFTSPPLFPLSRSSSFS